MAPLLSVDGGAAPDPRARAPLPSERVPLAEAAGRVLAEPTRERRSTCRRSRARRWTASRCAPRTRPGGCRSSARIAAGHPAPRPLAPGEAMGIATGGVVPEGADAVVPIEMLSRLTQVEVPAVEPGAHVRPRGGDLRRGDIVVERRHRLRPARARGARRRGIGEVACARRPRTVVVTTGRELRRPGEALAPGQIFESNGVMLAAALASAGAAVEPPGVGRRRRGRASRGARARPRGRRPRHLRRRVGRAARSRPADRARSSASRRSSGASP